jgi:hypothetical protein
LIGLLQGGVSKAPAPEPLPQVSIISWVNDFDKWNEILLSYLHPLWNYQKGGVPVEFISITPEDNCRNLGEAYELGRRRSRSDIRCYFHQDMTVTDPSFLLKLVSIANVCPRIGALGFVGSRVDTGASWMHADIEHSVGIHLTNKLVTSFSDCSFERVALVDGFGFITLPSAANMHWPNWYSGVHMVVEDMTMAIRSEGLEVWTIDSASYHESPGKADETYWQAAQLFYDIWHSHMDSNAQRPDLLLKEAQRRSAAQAVW